MIRVTDIAHMIMREVIRPGDWAVDATVGNGRDADFLARRVGPSGHVFGFDVQKTALDSARTRLGHPPNVTLIHAGHERMANELPDEAQGRLAGVMFNLGYLPGADKAIITRGETTLAAAEAGLRLLRTGGVMTLVVYTGHEGGPDEAAAVDAYIKALPKTFAVTRHVRLDAGDKAPYVIAVERLSSTDWSESGHVEPGHLARIAVTCGRDTSSGN